MRWLTLVVLLAIVLPQPTPALKTSTVRKWAKAIGEELWELNKALLDPDKIKAQYKDHHASVKKKDGSQILDSALLSVSTMLNRKINAVRCIHAKAKQLASEFFSTNENNTANENFTYCSAKYSIFIDENGEPSIDSENDERPKFAKESNHYLNVSLEKDSHFYEIDVNTNSSCVHVPTNIYYLEDDAKNAILWTEGLNEVFVNNYKSDPSLAWQYFGTAQGVLRFYPGMPWQNKRVDEYDCRVRTWYIEAATCSKEVIILFDVSGSMTGFKNYVARRTIKSILSTLSNNDYVNVYAFNKDFVQAVSCFNGLVQATPENKKTIENTLEPEVKKSEGVLLEQYVHKIPLIGSANLTKAYIEAFKILKDRRKNCNVSAPQGCNQNIMVITDFVPGNLSDVFDKYNRVVEGNATYTPVRVFTFLIGKEVTNVKEIQSMACNNRGHFVHIRSVEEVQEQVLQYINVIARPMILSDPNPPPTWTHANIDDTRTFWKVSGPTDLAKPDEDKLVTSVAIPTYEFGEANKNATLLGVAGTDVPLDSIAKLAQPHQLGVNGYPLIVSNNGFLLLHPLLIATINGELQDNFNSVDIVEVEQVDDGKDSRELGKEIQELRNHLVNGNKTAIEVLTGTKVLYHYDRMRRIARVQHDYFVRGLNDTPFSMGISLPAGYGVTELDISLEPRALQWGRYHPQKNVTDYFRQNFRVHPDWVYCKYHYLEGHEHEDPEHEIFEFLVMSSHDNLVMKKQYEEEEEETTRWLPEFSDDEFEKRCGENRSHVPGRDEYYCTEDLVNQLTFDAIVMQPFFKNWAASEREKNKAKSYNVSVRFIATSSGLTKWHYVNEDKNEYVNEHGKKEKKSDEAVFGDIYHNAIEETWYKAAVLQHTIKTDTLVVATELPILDKTIKDRPVIVDNQTGDITITASIAIFYEDKGEETPAAVSGFQFSYLSFLKQFNKTISMGSTDKNFTCGERYSCYLVDSSGYVVLTKKKDDVGRFFSVIDINTKHVMQNLIDETVFEFVEVFNYQALCPNSYLKKVSDSAWSLTTPFSIAGNLIKWLLAEVTLLVLNWNQYAYAEFDESETMSDTPLSNSNNTVDAEEEETFSCDHRITLYLPNRSRYYGKEWPIFSEKTNCIPRYWASRVDYTNLLLVVIEDQDDYDEGCAVPTDTTPRATPNSTTQSEPCHKLQLGGLFRRALEGCYTFNEKENEINLCDGSSTSRSDLPLLLAAALLASLASTLLSS